MVQGYQEYKPGEQTQIIPKHPIPRSNYGSEYTPSLQPSVNSNPFGFRPSAPSERSYRSYRSQSSRGYSQNH